MPTKEVMDRLMLARTKMLLRQPFFGTLAIRMKLIESEEIPTCATDMKNFYYNSEFIMALDVDELCFVFAHEVLHACYLHLVRRSGREPALWNAACDYAINWELKECAVGKIPAKFPPLLDVKYKNMSSDEIYDLLKKDKNAQSKGLTGFDIHLEPNGGQDGNNSQEVDDLINEWKDAVIQSAKQNKGAGNVPAGILRLVKEITEPTLDWRALINQQIISLVKSDFTFQRQSRKSMSMGSVYLPGMKNDEKIDVSIAIDTSGSISEKQVSVFLGEIKGIMQQFPDYDLRVWCFDTKTYTIHHYTPDNTDDIDDFNMEGGGGTTFSTNWERMEEEGIEPKKFIMFTDSYDCNSGYEKYENYCETLFVVHGNKGWVPPFGMSVDYEE